MASEYVEFEDIMKADTQDKLDKVLMELELKPPSNKQQLLETSDPHQLITKLKTYPKGYHYDTDELKHIIRVITCGGGRSFLSKVFKNKESQEVQKSTEDIVLDLFITSFDSLKPSDMIQFRKAANITYSSKNNVEFIKRLYQTLSDMKNKHIKRYTISNSCNNLLARLQRRIPPIPQILPIPPIQQIPAHMLPGYNPLHEMFIKAPCQKIIDYLIVKNPQYMVSAYDYGLVIQNSAVTWEEADQMYDIFKSRGFVPDITCFTIHIRYNYSVGGYDSITQKLVSDLIALSPNNFELMVKTVRDNECRKMDNFAEIVSKLAVPITLEILHSLIGTTYKYPILGLMNNLKEKPTIETLKLACKYGNKDLVAKLCESIEPTQECLHIACSFVPNIEVISTLYNYKLLADNKCFTNLMDCKCVLISHKDRDNLVQLLFYCGLSLSTEIIEYGLARGYVIKDLDIKGYNSWNDLKKVCEKLNYCPPQYAKHFKDV